MSNNKHVLIIPVGHFATNVYPLAGIFEYHQAVALSESGYKVGVISIGSIPFRKECFFYPYKKEEQLNSISILREYKRFWIPHRYASFSVLKKRYLVLFMNQYQKYVNQFGVPDIIHAHNFLYSGIIAQEINKKFKIPYIVTEHSSSFAMSGVSNDLDNHIIQCSKSSKHILAVSSSFVDLLNKRFNINCSLLPNILDNSFICSNLIKKKPKNPYVFLNVAFLNEIKNHGLLIRAFAKNFKDSEFVLKIGGSGHLLNPLKTLCKELGVENQVFFLGLLDRAQVKHEMANANCFVLSSNYETFGVVLIEALSCGTPIISTKCGGPIDIVDENNGLLVDLGDVEQLAEAMEIMYEKAGCFPANKLREDVINKFGKDAFLSSIHKFYS